MKKLNDKLTPFQKKCLWQFAAWLFLLWFNVWILTAHGFPLILITFFASLGICWPLWTHSHLLNRRLNLFSAEMETTSREKGQTQFVKDIEDASQLVSATTPDQVAVAAKHLQGYSFGIPLLSKPATDHILGKRLVRQTIWNDHLAEPVIGFVGEVGSGKSMAMTEMAMKHRALGYKLIANDEGLAADFVFEDLEELYEIMDMSIAELYKSGKPPETFTLICFDEIQNTFDSRDFKNFDPKFWARATQRRKYGFRLVWTAPKEEYVDIRVRQMTKWIWHCSITPLLKRYKRECFPPMEEVTIGECPRQVTKTWLRAEVLEAYNTFAFVNSFSKKGESVKSKIIGQVEKLEGATDDPTTKKEAK